MQSPAKIAIMGVTGFIGSGLPVLLAEKGWSVTGVSRAGKGRTPGVENWQTPDKLDFSGYDAVINLAGEPIDQRWTDKTKRLFRESRVGATEKVVRAIGKLPENLRPRVLVNGSAVGIYGDSGDATITEESPAATGDYLADLCTDWENAALAAQALGVRVALMRTGIVLGREGRAFQKLRTAFNFGLGGRLGSGTQWMPWIHVDDLRSAIVHCVTSNSISGPVNGSAPAPERNTDFTRKLASVMHRPAILPVPGFALKIAFGEFGGHLLGGQRALPSALLADGFRFKFPNLETALTELLSGSTQPAGAR